MNKNLKLLIGFGIIAIILLIAYRISQKSMLPVFLPSSAKYYQAPIYQPSYDQVPTSRPLLSSQKDRFIRSLGRQFGGQQFLEQCGPNLSAGTRKCLAFNTNPTSCAATPGCTWISLGSESENPRTGYCTFSDARFCVNHMTERSCNADEFCHWSRFPYPRDPRDVYDHCSRQPTPTACAAEATAGCYWDPSRCFSSPPVLCPSQLSAPVCNTRRGCAWDGSNCIEACSVFSNQVDCERTPNQCVWGSCRYSG